METETVQKELDTMKNTKFWKRTNGSSTNDVTEIKKKRMDRLNCILDIAEDK